jgi:hypothetical protein
MSSAGKRPKPKIFFFCDRKKCPNCNQQCQHTSDISHALRPEGDFKRNEVDGSMWQVGVSLDGVAYDSKGLSRLTL